MFYHLKKLVVTIGFINLLSTVMGGESRVYFGTEKSDGIYVATFDDITGELSTPQLAISIANPGFITIHPNNKYLYTTTSGITNSKRGGKNGGVAALRINSDDSLTLINKQSSEGSNPCHVSLDKTGQCLMVANYGGGNVAALKLNEDGSLAESKSIHQHAGFVPNSKYQKGPHPHSIYVNPKNNFAYAPDFGIDKVMIYKLNPNEARLTKYGEAVVPGEKMGPRHMKWSADGKYAYVLSELGCKVSLYSAVPESGKLKYRAELSTLPEGADKTEMDCSEIRIHPNQKFIYAATRDNSNQKRDLITVFNAFENQEKWRQIETISAEVSVPRNFNIDPSGKWLLVAGKRSQDIAIFSINPATGKLTFTGKKVPFPGTPICIEFTPLDKTPTS